MKMACSTGMSVEGWSVFICDSIINPDAKTMVQHSKPSMSNAYADIQGACTPLFRVKKTSSIKNATICVTADAMKKEVLFHGKKKRNHSNAKIPIIMGPW
jgi:bacillopeptidase F (M6 metalloprotease family)